MIREAAISALDGLVGFRQPIDTTYDILDSGNLTSSSGKYFEDISGLVTIKNIIDTYEETSLSDAQLNTMLDNLRASATRDVLNKIFEDESINIESNTLFPYEENFKNTHILTKDFYFIKLTPSKNKRIVTCLDNIILSFDSVATFNIYLYSSQSLLPIQTKSVTTVANQATKIYLGWALDNIGTYRIGFKRTGTGSIGSAKPFKRDYQLSNVYTKSTNCLIEFRSANFLVSGRIDVDNEDSMEDGIGMNLEYSSFVDYTNEIIKNKDRFATAVQLQMALTVADRIITSVRSNITQRLSDEAINKIAFTVGNDERGLKGYFIKELKSIKDFFFKENKIITATLI